jgi:hypothetical protein
MVDWILKHPQARFDMLGFLPDMLNERDPRPAREQLDHNYRHGGGWHPFQGHRMTADSLVYPGDPPMPLLAEARLRDEIIRFYSCSWVAIVQPDGSYEVCRMD